MTRTSAASDPARGRVRTIVLACLATIAFQGCVEGKSVTSNLATIDRMIDQVAHARVLDRATVERIVGGALAPVEQNVNFRTYRSGEVREDALTLTAELREPNREGDPSNGSLLIVRISAGCPAKKAVEAKYAPWTLTNVPRGGSLDEETSWSRQEPWGKLSFGFTERSPDCLSTVVFDANK